MFLNFGRFFGFGFQSKFDNLIKQENLTIETVLNEEEILSELKNQSSGKFADFIIANPQEYKKMIDYVIADVESDSQDMVRYSRYPFLISEILGSENEKLINFLFEKPEQPSQEDIQNPLEDQPTEAETQIEDPKPNEYEQLRASLLEDLLKLLDRDAILITTAGYFTKIIAAIIHKRGYDFWEQLKHQPEVLSNMFKHASTRHITEIFEKLIILDTSQEEAEEHAYLEERKQLVVRILRFLNGKKYSILIVQNICEVFIELYRRALLSLETMTALREILLQLVTPSFFMNLALQTQSSAVYSLLNIQFEFYTKIESLEEGKYQINFATLYKPVIEQVSKALEQNDCFKASFRNSYGEILLPLGDTKLLLIQFFISLLRRQELYPFLLTAKPFQQIIDLVRQHPQNNQLHVLFEKLIVAVIEVQSSHIQGLLFEETNLVEFLIKWNGSEERKLKHGYQGILTKITNFLIANSSQSQELSKKLTTFAQQWEDYVKSLSEVNEKEQQWILGINPKYREQQVNVESLSPPLSIPEPLVTYPVYNSSEIRKTDSIELVDSKPVETQEAQAEFQEPQAQTVVNQEVVVENLNNSDSDKEIQHQEEQQPIEGEGELVGNNADPSGPQEEYQVKEVDLDQPEVEAEPRVEREILPSPISVNQQQEFPEQPNETVDTQVNNEPESQEKIEQEQEQLQKEQPEQQEQETVQQEEQPNQDADKVNQDQEMREPEPQEQQLQQQNENQEEPQAEPNTESQEQQKQEEKSES